jgi:pilus assembly protein Flp/PilA
VRPNVHARERGASAVEYALLLAAIAAVVAVVIVGLRTVVVKKYDDSCDTITSQLDGTTCTTPAQDGH